VLVDPGEARLEPALEGVLGLEADLGPALDVLEPVDLDFQVKIILLLLDSGHLGLLALILGASALAARLHEVVAGTWRFCRRRERSEW
jgi:hypothetical protein